jgi:hypothetical protein
MHNHKNGNNIYEVEEPLDLHMNSSWKNIPSKWNDERRPALIVLYEI